MTKGMVLKDMQPMGKGMRGKKFTRHSHIRVRSAQLRSAPLARCSIFLLLLGIGIRHAPHRLRRRLAACQPAHTQPRQHQRPRAGTRACSPAPFQHLHLVEPHAGQHLHPC